MKNKISFILLSSLSFLTACEFNQEASPVENPGEAHQHDEHGFHLSYDKVARLQLQMGPMPQRNLQRMVKANGHLRVPPQAEASVSPMIGATVSKILVLEGDEVEKGQPLLMLAHPDLMDLQDRYFDAFQNEGLAKKEWERQKELAAAKVNSGKVLQEAERDYQLAKARLSSLASQCEMLGMNLSRLQAADFYQQLALRAPIQGHVKKVQVQTGQYINANASAVELIDVSHLHVDLMIFEQDIVAVKEGQKVLVNIPALGNQQWEAEIFAVGKNLEEPARAVHIHADLLNERSETLLPGMYVQAYIVTDSANAFALPEEALVKEGDTYYYFAAEESKSEKEWEFEAVATEIAFRDGDWVQLELGSSSAEKRPVALNQAFYLLSEWKKGEGGHEH